jgi:hypothetical protein
VKKISQIYRPLWHAVVKVMKPRRILWAGAVLVTRMEEARNLYGTLMREYWKAVIWKMVGWYLWDMDCEKYKLLTYSLAARTSKNLGLLYCRLTLFSIVCVLPPSLHFQLS